MTTVVFEGYRSLTLDIDLTLDVFHFDLYSTALSKIERGTEQDYADTLAVLKGGRIAWPRLQACFDEIMPHFGKRSLKQDPADFEKKFRALERKWRAAETGKQAP